MIRKSPMRMTACWECDLAPAVATSLAVRPKKVGRIAHLLGHRQGFAGERRLVDADVVALDQGHVGRHDLAQPEAHHVARHQGGGIDRRPGPVALHMGFRRQALFKRRQGVGSLALLPKADAGVVKQQNQDDGEVDPVSDQQGQDRRHFDHPRDRPPKIGEQLAQQALFFRDNRVRPVFLQALLRLIASQPRRGGLQGLELIFDRNGLGVAISRCGARRSSGLRPVVRHGVPPCPFLVLRPTDTIGGSDHQVQPAHIAPIGARTASGGGLADLNARAGFRQVAVQAAMQLGR
jgi:hypothetical protein